MEPLKVIDTKTGEVVTEIKLGDKILRKESADYLVRTVEIEKNEPYVKVYAKTMFEIAKRLDGVSIQLLNMLLPFISYEDGILEHPNGRPLTRGSIIELSQLNKTTVDKCINKLIELEVIGKHKTGRKNCYTVNPFVFMKGKRISKTLYKMFENSRWAKVENTKDTKEEK